MKICHFDLIADREFSLREPQRGPILPVHCRADAFSDIRQRSMLFFFFLFMHAVIFDGKAVVAFWVSALSTSIMKFIDQEIKGDFMILLG